MRRYIAVNSGIFIGNSEVNAAVAYIYHADSDNYDDDISAAKLFAAAPDLLEALQGMLEINSLDDAHKLSRFKAANAAIAKALGETK